MNSFFVFSSSCILRSNDVRAKCPEVIMQNGCFRMKRILGVKRVQKQEDVLVKATNVRDNQ